jgi:hypothetical protein
VSVTGSLAEVRAALALAAESLGAAHGHARVARERLDEALRVLVGLDTESGASLVPHEYHRAGEELDAGLALIGSGREAVEGLDARL